MTAHVTLFLLGITVDEKCLGRVHGRVNTQQRDVFGVLGEPACTRLAGGGFDESSLGQLGQRAAHKAGARVHAFREMARRDTLLIAPAGQAGQDMHRNRELDVVCHNCYYNSNNKKERKGNYKNYFEAGLRWYLQTGLTGLNKIARYRF